MTGRRVKTRRPTPKSARRAKTAVVRRRARQHGGSFWSKLKSFGSSANNWLRRTKLISKGAKFASQLGLPYSDKIGMAGELAQQMGYGKRKRMVRRRRRYKGKGISPTGGAYKGGALRRTGAGLKKKAVMPRYLGISY
jgi:hypothetical protein